jgi:enoyl-CoA hydratase/carnithine racemase
MALLYQKEGRIAYFTINRPEAFNSIDPETTMEFKEAMADFRDDPDMWVGIITGAGDKAFSAGADLKKMVPWIRGNADNPEQWRAILLMGMEVWKPIIAAINGATLGGGLELALGCDIRIASENATFGQPEVKVGLIPGWGGTQRLTRFVSRAKAAELLLIGGTIKAQEALNIGLINEVVPQAELMTTAKKWADRLCGAAPLAVRAAKEAMIKGMDLPLKEGLDVEAKLFLDLFSTADYEEGVSAFVEKRKPEFKAK